MIFPEFVKIGVRETAIGLSIFFITVIVCMYHNRKELTFAVLIRSICWGLGIVACILLGAEISLNLIFAFDWRGQLIPYSYILFYAVLLFGSIALSEWGDSEYIFKRKIEKLKADK